MQRLLDIMERLRDPESGCPWDREQSFSSLTVYTIEEAYEVADAIGRGDMKELLDELGDLLFQIVFYAQLAKEAGHFDFQAVAAAVSEKMIRRHPHVFGGDRVAGVAEQSAAWERHKAAERRRKAAAGGSPGQLDGVARALPALSRAEKLQRRAAKVGFDWPAVDGVLGKVREELEEVEHECRQGASADRLREELGDLLFSCVNLARHLGIDAEGALREANGKFEGRFRAMERMLRARGKRLSETGPAELEALWVELKGQGGGPRDTDSYPLD